MYKILVINPGSTSTKLAIFEDSQLVGEKTLRHSIEEIDAFSTVYEQKDFRKKIILDFLNSQSIKLEDFSAIIGRGGLLRPIPGGTYRVTREMLSDLRAANYGEHASNLGAILAMELSRESDAEVPSFIADPVVVDEMEPVARISGHPDFERKSIFHALNQKAVARSVASKLNKKYEDLNLIVVHMGGGISIGAHMMGKVVDVNNALDGDGPYTPERSGTLPLTSFIKLCYSGKYSYNEIKKLIKGQGGLAAYTRTSDCMEIQKEIGNGNKEWELYYMGMGYQIVKWVGKMAAVLKGNVDAIIFTGGIAYDKNYLMPWMTEKVSFIAPVETIPGGDEELALALAGLRVLDGEEKAFIYEEVASVR